MSAPPPPYEPPPPYTSLHLGSLSAAPVVRRTADSNQLYETVRRVRMIFFFNLFLAMACLGMFLGLRKIFCSWSDSSTTCDALIAVLILTGVLVLISAICWVHRYALFRRSQTKASPSFLVARYHHRT